MSGTPSLPEWLALKESIESLRREVVVYRQGVGAESQRLHMEAEVGRVLNRYSRRTWLVMTAGIVWFVLNLSDAARAYAGSYWWDLLFWPSEHGGDDFHPFQVIGFLWQAAVLMWLWRRSQVPPWLVDRVRAPKSMGTKKEDMERLRLLHEQHDSS